MSRRSGSSGPNRTGAGAEAEAGAEAGTGSGAGARAEAGVGAGAEAEAKEATAAGAGVPLQAVLRLVLRLLVRLVLLLAAVSLITFGLLHASPIDPVQAYIGADLLAVGPEQRALIGERWGLNEPFMIRYGNWLQAVLQGDWGMSAIYRVPVSELLLERFAASAALMGLSWLLGGVLGFALGALAAMHSGKWLDRLISGWCYLLASTPAFWVGLLLLLVFAVQLGWLPFGLAAPPGVPAGEATLAERLRHLVLPVMTLSVVSFPAVALHTRQKLGEVLDSAYLRYARARGISGWLLLRRHGLRNVALPALTLQFASFSELFGGAVLAEQVFAYPGLGQAAVEAGLRGDAPLLMGVVIGSALFVFVGNSLAELLYRLVDPRMRRAVNG